MYFHANYPATDDPSASGPDGWGDRNVGRREQRGMNMSGIWRKLRTGEVPHPSTSQCCPVRKGAFNTARWRAEDQKGKVIQGYIGPASKINK